MITLYTSVGRYELRKNENGEKQPIVKVDQKEMALSREELLLWSCLMWEILTKEEAKTYFLKKAVRMDVSQERFDAVLQRLEVRQLVVSAQAEKGDLALYRLLANLYVIPLESSFMVKVQAFFRFIFFEKLPLTVAKNVFQKENYTEITQKWSDVCYIWQERQGYPVQRFLHVSQMMKLILLLETSRSFRRRRHAIISVSFCGFVTDIERLWRRFLHYI